MELQTKIQAPDESRNVATRLVNENLSNKLNSYLATFTKPDIKWILELKIDKDKKWRFIWVLHINIDGKVYRYEREDYKNLDDLINNLFDHFKLDLSNK